MTQEEKLQALKSEEAVLQEKLLLLDTSAENYRINLASLNTVQQQIQELESA